MKGSYIRPAGLTPGTVIPGVFDEARLSLGYLAAIPSVRWPCSPSPAPPGSIRSVPVTPVVDTGTFDEPPLFLAVPRDTTGVQESGSHGRYPGARLGFRGISYAGCGVRGLTGFGFSDHGRFMCPRVC